MFTVRWEKEVLDELARLWPNADSAQRQAITSATHAIDQVLRVNPSNKGESRSSGRRITFAPPLAVVFRVNAAQKIVSILQVRLFRRREP